MTKREEDKKKSLSFLAGIAETAEDMPWLEPKPRSTLPPPRAPPPRPRAAPPPPPPQPRVDPEAERLRKKRLEERQAKLEEERRLKARRQQELARGSTLSWRGMSWGDVPTSVRRTPFDREEPSVSQKITDVLGDPKEKEGRAKNRDKGRRQGGR